MIAISEATFLVFDVETTGLDSVQDKVCEVACVAVRDGQIVDRKESLINPGRPIPPAASRVHGIYDEDVKSAPYLHELDWVLPEHHCMAAHNARFDSAFLAHLNHCEWLCTQRLARKAIPGCPSYSNQNLRSHLKLHVPDAEGKPAHRALADALVSAALLIRILECLPENAPRDLGGLIQWANQPVLLTTCHFGKHKGTPWSQVPLSYLQWMISPDGFTRMDSDMRYTVNHYLNRARS